jgi:PAS domain S-box-containing protein
VWHNKQEMQIGKLSKKLYSSANLEHSRLTSLINSMADGVIAVDRNINVVIYNGAGLNILDRNDPIENKSLTDIFHPIDKDEKTVNVAELVKSATVPITNRDLRLKYNDGSIINVYISIAPVRLGFGEIGQRGYVILLRDITNEKSLEEERDEFISVASHELRTPIAIAEGNISNAQFIANKSGDLEQVKKALNEAHNQVLFLADLVNDLSTLARAERGKLTIGLEAIDIPRLISELVGDYEPQAKSKGLKLKSEVDQAVTTLDSSELYVREVLQNFITNALKYTETGSITIVVKSHKNGLQFAIEDTGIGISRSDQQRVFDKFFRSEDFRTRKTNGTGLGLYVTAKLADLLQAKVTLSSKLNCGSTFSITIPNLPLPPASR